MAYYPEGRQLGPHVDTTWGRYGTRFTQYDPDEYVQRAYPWPQDIRGGNGFVPQPGFGPPSPYVPRPVGHFGEGVDTNKLSLILLLAGVAILAYFIGKDSGVRRNSGVLTNRTGRACPCSCGGTRRRRRRNQVSRRRKLRRQACSQPRNALGQFVAG